jgi:hypothetical protein
LVFFFLLFDFQPWDIFIGTPYVTIVGRDSEGTRDHPETA